MKNNLSPSILSADFGKLNEEIRKIEKHSDSLHLDIMDGHFVPNISYGSPIVKDIKTKLPMDCHLMITDPLKYAKDFAPYVNRIFFHAELFDRRRLRSTINGIKKLGVECGLALNPDKSIDIIRPVLKDIDAVLIMSVYAGFGGQKFMPEVLGKIHVLRAIGFRKDILIDGGINKETIFEAASAGANVFIAGSAIFSARDSVKAIKELRDAL